MMAPATCSREAGFGVGSIELHEANQERKKWQKWVN